MRIFVVVAAVLAIAAPAFADDNRVPAGDYYGEGVWSDTAGNSGTAEVVYAQADDQASAYTVSRLSDGRVYEGNFLYASLDAYRYAVNVDYFGQVITIGAGMCAVDQCQTTVQVSPTEVVTETAIYDLPGSLVRLGTITNLTTGVVTFYRVTMHRRGN